MHNSYKYCNKKSKFALTFDKHTSYWNISSVIISSRNDISHIIDFKGKGFGFQYSFVVCSWWKMAFPGNGVVFCGNSCLMIWWVIFLLYFLRDPVLPLDCYQFTYFNNVWLTLYIFTRAILCILSTFSPYIWLSAVIRQWLHRGAA